MATKLTLSLDSKVIKAAKKYSAKKGLSISRLVENYLKKITQSEPKKNPAQSSLMQLRGVFGKLPSDYNYREERDNYLREKYK